MILKTRGIDLRPELELELQMALHAVSQRLAPVYVALRQTVETLASPASDADLAKIVALLEPLRSDEARRNRPAATPGPGGPPNAIAGAVRGIGVPQKELHELLRQPSDDSRDRYARDIMRRYATAFDALAAALAARIAAVTFPASEICNDVFTPDASAPASLGTQVRTMLGDYYRTYDRYDLISYPILYSTEVGDEVDPVEVIRISPEDAKSLIDERKPDERRRKLAGTALMHFGAFLDRHWRQNDILWGRLDGTERLIAAVTQGSLLSPDVRTTLLERAQLAIFGDQRDASTIEATCDLLAGAMATADGGPDAKKIRALVAAPPGASGNPVVREALLAAAEPKRVREFYRDAYEVDRGVNSLAALRAMSRSSRVFGRLLEGIADRHGVRAASAAWLTRASSIFWGLVEVSVPRSFKEVVFRYWLQLVYLFDLLMIIGGTVFVERSVQRFGLVLLGLTIAVHLASLAIRDVIRRRRGWIRAIVTLGVLAFLVLAGIGVVHARETWDAVVAWVRAWF
jgi:hypothetical protein